MNHASRAVAPPDVEVVQVDDVIWQRAKRGSLVQGAVLQIKVRYRSSRRQLLTQRSMIEFIHGT
jgi:hypothetical protein